MFDPAHPQTADPAFSKVNTKSYPPVVAKAQPWMQWMKLVPETPSGKESIVSVRNCKDILSNGLGGY